MKKLIIFCLSSLWLVSCKDQSPIEIASLVNETSKIIINDDGNSFRDLNHNGSLDIYEDPRQSIENRIENLLSQMSVEDKAGMMFINGAPVSMDGDPNKPGTGPAAMMATVTVNIDNLKMNHFNVWEIPSDPAVFAAWYNRVQLLAEKTRLGIPITIASDPRHHLGKNVIQMSSNGFSQFCELPGFAAIGDEKLVRDFAEIVRKEYAAIGIREALFPQIDLATEPRWARISGNFSEDAALTARLVKPYIEALQTDNLANGIGLYDQTLPRRRTSK